MLRDKCVSFSMSQQEDPHRDLTNDIIPMLLLINKQM